MKFSLVAIAAVIGSVEAITKPSLSLSLTDGTFADMDGLDPSLTWSGSASAGEIDIDYGIESSVKPTADIASLPKRIWGVASWESEGVEVSVKADKDMASDVTDVGVGIEVPERSISIAAAGTLDGGVDVSSTSISKKFNDGAFVPTFTFRSKDDYDVAVDYSTGDTTVKASVTSSQDKDVEITHSMDNTDVTVAYSNDEASVVVDHSMSDSTDIKLTASADNQEVTISQQIDDDNKISPTINRNGAFSVAWERDLGDDNSLTATLVPDESVDIEWKDDNWTANINAGLSGASVEGISVSAKRDINF